MNPLKYRFHPVTLFFFILLLFFNSPDLLRGQDIKAIPTQFEDYRVYINPDSLEKIVYAQKNNPTVYLHGLISLEMSRYHISDKFGQDLDTIKVLAERQGSELGLAMHGYLNAFPLFDIDISEVAKVGYRILQYFEKTRDTLGMVIANGHLLKANINSESLILGDISESKKYFDRIIDLGKNTNSVAVKLQVARIYLVFNRELGGEKNLNKEKAIFQEAIKLIDKNPRYEHLRSLIYMHMGTVFMEEKDYLNQLEYNLKAYALVEKYKSKYRIPQMYNIGICYNRIKKYDESEKFLQKAINLYKEKNEDRIGLLQSIYTELARTEQLLKKYEKAWQTRNIADSLNEILQVKLKSTALLDIQTKYETQKKELENKRLALDAKEQKQKAELWSLLTILLILVSSATILIYSKTKEKNIQLTQLNELIALRNEDLKIANQRMEHFTNTLSHDALGYINNILSYTDLGQNMSQQTEYQPIFQTIFRNTSRLKGMSENLISYNKKRQITNFQKVNVKNIILEAIEDMSKLLSEQETHLEIESHLMVYANREFVKEVLKNLFHNAVKFRKEIPFELKISAQYYSVNHILVIIKDNGIGISEKKLPKIFDEFVKLDDNSEGSGLGLFICKQIIEGMGGRIWAESKEGEGSTFYFTLLKNVPPQ